MKHNDGKPRKKIIEYIFDFVANLTQSRESKAYFDKFDQFNIATSLAFSARTPNEPHIENAILSMTSELSDKIQDTEASFTAELEALERYLHAIEDEELAKDDLLKAIEQVIESLTQMQATNALGKEINWDASSVDRALTMTFDYSAKRDALIDAAIQLATVTMANTLEGDPAVGHALFVIMELTKPVRTDSTSSRVHSRDNAHIRRVNL